MHREREVDDMKIRYNGGAEIAVSSYRGIAMVMDEPHIRGLPYPSVDMVLEGADKSRILTLPIYGMEGREWLDPFNFIFLN